MFAMKTMVFVLSVCFLMGIAQADSLESDFDRFFCDERGASGECTLYRVSIINLFTTPEKFHGKRVKVIGYLTMGGLYFSKRGGPVEALLIQFADWELTEESINSYREKEKQIKAQFNYCRVLMEAEFDMHARAFFDRGGLKKITRLEKWDSKPCTWP
jgi:hypothetical protein